MPAAHFYFAAEIIFDINCENLLFFFFNKRNEEQGDVPCELTGKYEDSNPISFPVQSLFDSWQLSVKLLLYKWSVLPGAVNLCCFVLLAVTLLTFSRLRSYGGMY